MSNISNFILFNLYLVLGMKQIQFSAWGEMSVSQGRQTSTQMIIRKCSKCHDYYSLDQKSLPALSRYEIRVVQEQKNRATRKHSKSKQFEKICYIQKTKEKKNTMDKTKNSTGVRARTVKAEKWILKAIPCFSKEIWCLWSYLPNWVITKQSCSHSIGEKQTGMIVLFPYLIFSCNILTH